MFKSYINVDILYIVKDVIIKIGLINVQYVLKNLIVWSKYLFHDIFNIFIKYLNLIVY